LFQACDIDDLVGLNYDEIKEYGTFLGDPHRSTVIIHSQGGVPSTRLSDAELIELIQPINTNEVIVANIRQNQISDSRSLYQSAITTSTADAINNQSVDDLAKVIRHFKSQNKKVYVFGTGFGGYLTQELIVRYGTDIADKYLIMGSRLKIENEFIEPWAEGKSTRMDYDATPTQITSYDEPLMVKANLNRLFAAIADQNYVELLERKDLSNVTYAFSDKDEIVGKLGSEEKSFLTEQNVRFIEAEGSHESGKKALVVEGMRVGFGLE